MKRLGDAVRRIGKHGASITWSFPEVIESVKGPWEDPNKSAAVAELPDLGEDLTPPPPKASDFPVVAPVVADAIAARIRVAHARREAALRKLGIRVVHARRTPQRAAPVEETPPEPLAEPAAVEDAPPPKAAAG